MKRVVFVLLFLFVGMSYVLATHQRAGEITYRYKGGLTYEFTIVTYTYTPSPADRPEIDVLWGDGTTSTITRTRKINMENEISMNTYIAEHTFPAAGQYSITFEDPNRNAGIVNIPNSVNIPFFLETILIVNPFLGGNNSPQLLNPPIDNGCVGVPYYHNPGAYDPDGDSLSYSLISCRGYDGEVVPGYQLPTASTSITIDPYTGDLIWDSPTMQGEYNIAILIQEWRAGVLIGSVVRDMQINIISCNNQPPHIETIEDTCVLAGTLLELDVTATDPNSTSVTLSATGSPFRGTQPRAIFPEVKGKPPVTGQFVWNTTCHHVQKGWYSVLFKAQDNGPQVELASFKTLRIRIVAPRPENLQAEPIGNEVTLTWEKSECDNVVGYDIYKRISSNPFEPEHCETGMPPEAGYRWIGATHSWQDTLFVDDGSVFPLRHGTEYCYRVVAFFADGAESYVSAETCISLLQDAPMITNVDVEETDLQEGVINVKWLAPAVIDSARFEPPYSYHLCRASSQNRQFVVLDSLLTLDDTSFVDRQLNTVEASYIYKLEIYGMVRGKKTHIESSDQASSIFLRATPSDRKVILSWQESVPWINTEYTVYKYNETTHQYDSIAVTTEQTYTDKALENGHQYCYYVRSLGGYFANDTVYPLYNRSQRVCAIPLDDTPPEVPEVVITTDCQTVTFEWSFSSDSSYQDVYQYYIYYKPSYNDPYTIFDSIVNNGENCYDNRCRYELTGLSYVVGCFAMAAIDTAGNLSAMSEETCFDVDDCLSYELPNVFTPNDDGVNDKLVPIKNENIHSVDFVLYNRWGTVVYKTTDPNINWDGIDCHTGRKSSDGVYFYVCELKVPTLTGEKKIQLQGSVTLISKFK